MKLLYQQMLAFFGVIAVTLTIVSVLFIRSTTNTVWQNSFDQLEQYTDVLKDRAVDQNTYLINSQFIQNSEEILPLCFNLLRQILEIFPTLHLLHQLYFKCFLLR